MNTCIADGVVTTDIRDQDFITTKSNLLHRPYGNVRLFSDFHKTRGHRQFHYPFNIKPSYRELIIIAFTSLNRNLTFFKTFLLIIKLGRLKFPAIGFLLYAFGFLLGTVSGFDFSWSRFVLGFVTSFTANLSVSYSNDYFDVNLDRYGKPTSVSGGSGILIRHPELMEFSKRLAEILMGISIIASIVSTVHFSLPLYFPVFVTFANLLSWYYVAPPLKLAYRGFSELTAVVAVGLLLPGSGYLMAQKTLDLLFLIFVLPSMLYSLAFIVSVEIPDLESDRLGGKNTLIVKKGRDYGFVLIGVLFTLSTLYFLALSFTNLVPMIDFRLISIVSLIPLSIMILEFFQLKRREDTLEKAVEHILLAFSVFLFLLNCYLIIVKNLNIA